MQIKPIDFGVAMVFAVGLIAGATEVEATEPILPSPVPVTGYIVDNITVTADNSDGEVYAGFHFFDNLNGDFFTAYFPNTLPDWEGDFMITGTALKDSTDLGILVSYLIWSVSDFSAPTGDDHTFVFNHPADVWSPISAVPSHDNHALVHFDFSGLVNGYLPAGTLVTTRDTDVVGFEEFTVSAVPVSGGNSPWLDFEAFYPTLFGSGGAGVPPTVNYDVNTNSYHVAAAGLQSESVMAWNTNQDLESITLDIAHVGQGSNFHEFSLWAPAGIPGAGTPGYWKNHPEDWPVEDIEIGGIPYSKADAIELMKRNRSKDVTVILFRSLVAAKLNALLLGNESSCVDQTIADADDWMSIYLVESHVKAGGKSSPWRIGEPLYLTLDDYNNGFLCLEARD
jgi:hypothetical protein